MSKLLFIVRGYYPAISASGNLIKPLVDEMCIDHDVTILSLSDSNESNSLNSNLKHFTIGYQKINENLIARLNRRIARFFGYSAYNEKIVENVKRKIEQLDLTYNYDFIIAVTCEEIIALSYCGVSLNKKYAFILERLNIDYPEKFSFLFNHKTLKSRATEAEIFNRLKGSFVLPVVYNSYSKYCNSYHKLTLVEHPMIVPARLNSIKSGKRNRIRLLYAGGLDRETRNPFPILSLLEKVHLNVDFEFHIYSYGNLQNRLIQYSQNSDYIYCFDVISKSDLENIIGNSDILISISNNELDIIPSKLFDYISTGKPIVHFSQLKNDPYDDYLERYGNFFKINYTDFNNEDSAKRLATFIIVNYSKVLKFEDIESNFLDCTPKYVKNRFLEVLENKAENK